MREDSTIYTNSKFIYRFYIKDPSTKFEGNPFTWSKLIQANRRVWPSNRYFSDHAKVSSNHNYLNRTYKEDMAMAVVDFCSYSGYRLLQFN
jgi:hypothetical protein